MRKDHFEVYIKSDGHELPEYQVEALDDTTLACYVPSEVGKTFEICWRRDTRHDTHSTSVSCYVDGWDAGGTLCRPGAVEGSRWGIRCAKDQRKPFQFASLVLTDDDTVATGSEAQQDSGTIQVKLSYAIRIASEPHFVTKLDQFKVGVQVVHEKSKQMGVQCISLGDSRKCKATDKVYAESVNPQQPSYSSFIFRYRSKDFLQAENIMPMNAIATNDAHKHTSTGRKRRTGQEPPNLPRKRVRTTTESAASPEPRSPNTQSAADEDINALQRKLDAAQGRVRVYQGKIQAITGPRPSSRVKPERREENQDVDDLTRGNIKRTRSPIDIIVTDDEVIDLTLDDD
ncbi:uncharacterized protein B0H18DRAFT_1207921 [Fomitopsis serialis]|uniref:uncharacterized protein n=1 Tax=Fomitopsis serialis TaxID=139415 RepID=UPI002007B7AF|nr:uncharacterized protein B0H18DRAFT_1207921 [Neoantrodia serialis]KAH9933760.1 hypothetical protein B0H18DRAFT_1207921 [Neoantrodia serialis]